MRTLTAYGKESREAHARFAFLREDHLHGPRHVRLAEFMVPIVYNGEVSGTQEWNEVSPFLAFIPIVAKKGQRFGKVTEDRLHVGDHVRAEQIDAHDSDSQLLKNLPGVGIAALPVDRHKGSASRKALHGKEQRHAASPSS